MSEKLRYADFVDRIDIDAFESAIGFDPVEQDGDEDRGHCIDIWGLHAHGDTTGKFSINREKKVYGCWVCGGGSLLSLAMEFNDFDAEEATDWIHQFAREGQTDEEFKGEIDRLLADPEEQVEVIPYFNERVLGKWEIVPHHGVSVGRRWLRKSGISDPIVKRYRIGFNEEHMRRPPKNKREDEDPYVGPAVILPHWWRGRLVGWQERWLDPDEDRPQWTPKYTNTPGFPRRTTLYNFDACEKTRRVKPVVVESVKTCLMLESLGIPSLATFGSNVTEEQLKLMRTFTQGVILSADNDKPKQPGAKAAGLKWRDNLTNYLEPYIDVLHVPLVQREKGDLGDLWPREDLIHDYIDRAYEPLGDVLDSMAERVGKE